MIKSDFRVYFNKTYSESRHFKENFHSVGLIKDWCYSNLKANLSNRCTYAFLKTVSGTYIPVKS